MSSSASRKLRGLIAKCGGVRCSFKPEPQRARVLIEIWAGPNLIGSAAIAGATLKSLTRKLVQLDLVRSDLATAKTAGDFFDDVPAPAAPAG
jgi:hypothetical protein